VRHVAEKQIRHSQRVIVVISTRSLSGSVPGSSGHDGRSGRGSAGVEDPALKDLNIGDGGILKYEENAIPLSTRRPGSPP
jgi:hypothetical protein